jgi:hypothetical protein
MADAPQSLLQPFRRNLKVPPVLFSVGLTATPTAVPAMTSLGVTSFIVQNACPFYFWFAGWTGQASDMPVIKENGHYLAPGEKYIGRTQMPQWVAAVADDEPAFPIYDDQGKFRYAGLRCRGILVYGSGA